VSTIEMFVTPGPTASTSPTPSRPKICGRAGFAGYIARARKASAGFKAAKRFRSTTSPGPATGSATSANLSFSAPSYDSISQARIPHCRAFAGHSDRTFLPTPQESPMRWKVDPLVRAGPPPSRFSHRSNRPNRRARPAASRPPTRHYPTASALRQTPIRHSGEHSDEQPIERVAEVALPNVQAPTHTGRRPIDDNRRSKRDSGWALRLASLPRHVAAPRE
jgi:hypothetical protein